MFTVSRVLHIIMYPNIKKSYAYFQTWIFLVYYGAESIGHARLCLLECLQFVGVLRIFWVAFQSNVLTDLNITTENFEETFEMFQNQLKYKMIVVQLKYNMRNSQQISETIPKGMLETQKTKMHIPHGIHSTAVMGKHTIDIPLPRDELMANKANKLHEVLNYAVQAFISPRTYVVDTKGQQASQDKSLKTYKRFAVLIEPPLFKELAKVVGDVLRKILEPQSIFIHPSSFLEGVRNPNEVTYDSFSDKNFSSLLDGSNDGILIARADECFGMETASLILISTGANSDRSFSNTRCGVLRAVEELVVINVVSNYFSINFDGALQELRFIRCKKGAFVRQCLDCKIEVCSSCLAVCHKEHIVPKQINRVRGRADEYCMCSKNIDMCKINSHNA